MSFVWLDFLTLAQRLVSDPSNPGPEEAALRTAISRAYYAAFRSAATFAQVQDGLTLYGTGEDHARVIAHFRFANDPSRKDIGFLLNRLKQRRTNADYDSGLEGEPKSRARSSVDIARNILKALGTLETRNTDD